MALGLSVPALSLAACAVVDADRARTCRSALPALEPAGTVIRVLRTAPSDAFGLRIDYSALRPGRPARNRFALCRFGTGEAGPGLVDITGPEGSLGGARVHLLQRYYLDTPEGVAGDPGATPGGSDLPELAPSLAYGVQQALVGLPRIAVYGLIGAAYALVFGLVGRINLAFGAIVAIGAAAAGLTVTVASFGGFAPLVLGLVAGLAVAILAGALHGLATGHLAFRRIAPTSGQASLIATIGLSLVLREYLRLASGTAPVWIPPLASLPVPLARAGDFVVTVTPISLAASGCGLAAAIGLVWLMRASRFGRAWRAGADDPLAAALFGIDPGRLLAATLLLAGALAGLAGALVAVQFGALGFSGAFELGLTALAATILGGVGSVGGALLGGLVIAVFETLWSACLPIAGRDFALHLLVIAAIVTRPNGLAGCPPSPRDRI